VEITGVSCCIKTTRDAAQVASSPQSRTSQYHIQSTLKLFTVAINESNSLVQTAKMKYSLTLCSLIASTLAVSYCPSPIVHTVTATAGSGYATGTGAAVPSASASSVPEVDNGYFGVISSRSASPIHLLPLTARGGKFYLGGGAPSSYCPTEIGAENCPPGNSTVLAGGDNTLSLGVLVPGGQQVYVDADGSLSYTQAHSAYLPEGSIREGFSREAPEGGADFGHLDFDSGFVACNAGEGQGYQVYGGTDDAEFGDDCLGFSALTGMFYAPVLFHMRCDLTMDD
jgi:hypothetical protein